MLLGPVFWMKPYLIPDDDCNSVLPTTQVPVRQRGTVSAIVGACQPLGVMVGAALIAFIPQTGTEEGSDAVGGQETRYFAVAGILAVTSALFVLFIREARLDPSRVDKLQWLEFIKSFWIDPRKYPDFAWVWITRFLVITGNAFVTTYLLFFTRDVLKLSPTEADTTVGKFGLYFYPRPLVEFCAHCICIHARDLHLGFRVNTHSHKIRTWKDTCFFEFTARLCFRVSPNSGSNANYTAPHPNRS